MRAAVRAEKGDVKKMNFKHLVVGGFWVDWNEWHALETNGMLCCAVLSTTRKKWLGNERNDKVNFFSATTTQ